MILQFECENHRSIKNKILYSMLATKDTSYSDKLIPLDNNINILRGCLLYGANGSGKTSLLNALYTFTQLVIESNTYQNEEEIIRFPHKLALTEPTTFNIFFTKNDIQYNYSISYDNNEIIKEDLSYWPNGKKAKIFERDNTLIDNEPKYKFYGNFKQVWDNCKGRLKKYKLLLSVAYNESSNKYIQDVFNFFYNDLVFIFPNKNNNYFADACNELSKSPAFRKTFIDFLRSIGEVIIDIKLDIDVKSFISDDLSFLSPEMQNKLKGKTYYSPKLKLLYPNGIVIDFEEESEGIRKLFSIMYPLIKVIQEDKILICDEIENSLHSNIVFEIIKRFFNNDCSKAQLLCTTHNTELLDLNLLRRDQIWFTEIEPQERQTALYSLSDIKNVRKDENVQKGYIAGKFGAVPMINTRIQKICEE